MGCRDAVHMGNFDYVEAPGCYAIHFMLAAFHRLTKRRVQVYQLSKAKGGGSQYRRVHVTNGPSSDAPDIYVLRGGVHYNLLSPGYEI